VGGWIQFGPLGTAATNRPVMPTPGDYNDGEIGGMMIGRVNLSTQRKPAPMPLCPPQTPHAARTRTRAAAVGSQRLTAWAMARPSCHSRKWPFCIGNKIEAAVGIEPGILWIKTVTTILNTDKRVLEQEMVRKRENRQLRLSREF
jgi:hypothetical protein